MRNRTELKAAAYSHSAKDMGYFLAYVLWFSDGSAYVGSCCGTYRLRLYNSIAEGRREGYTKNPLLVTGLKAFECSVTLRRATSLEEAREYEKKMYTDLTARNVTLRNCREFGHAGKWIQQDPETEARRLKTLRENGRTRGNFGEKLPDGRSRASIKAVLSRALSKGQELKKLKNLDPLLLAELLAELEHAQ